MVAKAGLIAAADWHLNDSGLSLDLFPNVQPLGESRRTMQDVRDLEEQGGIDFTEYFIDGTFTVIKKSSKIRKIKRDKDTKLMVIADVAVLHLPCAQLLLRHMKLPL